MEVSIMLFDTHAHMDSRSFDCDREALLADLPNRGIRYLMNPGCSLASSHAAVELANKYDYIYAAVGSHPDAADEVNDAVIAEYRELCKLNPKIKAIGEIGLDYHYEDIPRQLQQKAFIAQLELAKELDLPVIVHERDAHEDGMGIIKSFPTVKGVFHCYSGSAEMARQLVDLGWYIGFTGVLTFKNARRAVETAESIPLERIVLETDCPYMAPTPFRGKRNDPGYLYRMAEQLAQIRGRSVEEIHEITVENGKRLYRID
jgi:TatD DNase family protein